MLTIDTFFKKGNFLPLRLQKDKKRNFFALSRAELVDQQSQKTKKKGRHEAFPFTNLAVVALFSKHNGFITVH